MKSLRVFFTPVAEAQCITAYKKLHALRGESYVEAWLEKLRAVLAEEAELLTLIDFNRPRIRLFKGHEGCHVLLFRVGGEGSDIWQILYERGGYAYRQESLCVIGLWCMTAGLRTSDLGRPAGMVD